MEEKVTLYEHLYFADTFELNAKELGLKIKVLARKQNIVPAAYGKALAKFIYFSILYLNRKGSQYDISVENIIKLYILEDCENVGSFSVLQKIVEQSCREYPEVINVYNDFACVKTMMPENCINVILDAFEEYCEREQIEFDRKQCEKNIDAWME